MVCKPKMKDPFSYFKTECVWIKGVIEIQQPFLQQPRPKLLDLFLSAGTSPIPHMLDFKKDGRGHGMTSS